VKGKEFSYSIAVERDGRIGAEGLTPLAPPNDWTPEHLLLAALVRCSLTSLRYHADRIGVDVLASGSASSTITRREADGRFAFQEIRVRLDLELEPELPGDELGALLAKAQRDCFIGASLAVPPRYEWTVNGAEASVPAVK
jgi:organic hydroperoxide reductase OsmC/OhrA